MEAQGRTWLRDENMGRDKDGSSQGTRTTVERSHQRTIWFVLQSYLITRFEQRRMS